MQFSIQDKVQRPLHGACVDEASSVQLMTRGYIIWKTTDQNTGNVEDNIIVTALEPLEPEDDDLEKDMEPIALSEQGNHKVERRLHNSNLISKNIHVVNVISQSLRAHKLMKRDVDYILKEIQR